MRLVLNCSYMYGIIFEHKSPDQWSVPRYLYTSLKKLFHKWDPYYKDGDRVRKLTMEPASTETEFLLGDAYCLHGVSENRGRCFGESAYVHLKAPGKSPMPAEIKKNRPRKILK